MLLSTKMTISLMKQEVKQMDFEQMMLQKAYEKVNSLGDRLVFMKKLVDWNSFRPIIKQIFRDNNTVGGRPHTDETVIIRIMVLQEMYGLSDEEMEFQANDRLSFRNFIGFADEVPDYSTIWKIRDRLKQAELDKEIWNELQRQINNKGYTIQKGVIQDASFIETDVGRKRYYKEKKAKKEGKTIEYTPKQISHIDKDGTFAVKAGQVHYGYKDHIKMDVKHYLVRNIEITTASLHDGKIQLITEKDIAAYRDKGYFGTSVPKNVIDKTMQRATRGKPLTKTQEKINRAISKIRSIGERPFSVIKYIFHGGQTFVKTLARVRIKETFKFFGYNLYQLFTIQRKELAKALSKC